MSYEVGSAYIQILPSMSGIVETIGAEAEKWGETAGQVFAETFKEIVNSELRDMNAVKIDADTSEASAKAQALRAEIADLKANVSLGVDETDIQEKLAGLEAELAALEFEHPEIRVGVDTGDAEAELGALTAESVVADEALKGVGDSGGGAAPGIEWAGGAAAEAGTGISGMAGAVAVLAVALLPIGGLALGAFAAIPAILSGAITAVGALYAGLEPIVTTLEAFGVRNAPTGGGGTSAASTAQSNATAQRNAAYSVQQAEEALANAQINGAQAVTNAQKAAAAATITANQNVINSETALVNAERTVTEAVYNEKQAQEAVIAARTAAANQLQDYTDQLADNAISQQQDQLNLQEAQDAYNQSVAPGSTATYDQQQQALINLEQAKQAIQDLGDQNGQLQATASAAFAAGVEGAQGVLDAEHNLQQATQAVTDAVAAQQTAQQNVATASTAAAQQQITNAQNIATAQRKNAQGVSDAQKALQQALDNQKDAFTKAAIPVASGSVGLRTYAQDLAKLSPAGQEFVGFVETQLLPAFTGVKDAAQKGLLPGLQSGLTDALPFFKDLSGFIGIAAKGIGDFAKGLGQFAGSTTGLTQLQQMFQNGDTFMGDLAQAATIFLEAFVGVGSQSKPIIDSLGTGIVNIAKSFANWVSNGGFQGFLNWLSKNGPQLVSDISDFLKAAGKLAVALTPIGTVLDQIVAGFSKFVTWLINADPLLLPVAAGLAAIAIATLAISSPVGLITVAIGLLVVGITLLASHWHEVWTNIKNWADDAWQYIDQHLFQPVEDFFTKTIPSAFDNFVNFCKALPGRALAALGDFAKYVWGALVIDATWLDTHIWQPISSFFTGLPDKIGKAATHMWDGIEAAFVTMFDAIIGVWNDFHFTLPHVDFLGLNVGGGTIGVPQIPLIPIPSYHTGGIVQGTPGVETLARLMPGELVTPAGVNFADVGAGYGSPIELHMTINGLDLTNKDMVRNEIVGAFAQWTEQIGRAS